MADVASNFFSTGDTLSASPIRSANTDRFNVLGLWSELAHLPGLQANADTAIALTALTIDGIERLRTDQGPTAAPPGTATDGPTAPPPPPAQEHEDVFDEHGVIAQRHIFGPNLTGMTIDYDRAGNIARQTVVKANNTLEETSFSPNETVTTIYDFTNRTVWRSTLNHRDGSVTSDFYAAPPGVGIPRPVPYVR